MSNVVNTQQTFAWAIKNPMSYVAISATWSTQDTSSSYMWNDKNVTKNTDGKSIFDPSPIGWRLPVTGTYSDFTGNISAIADNTSTYKSGSVDASYFATARRDSGSSALSSFANNIFHWFSTPQSTSNGYRLYITSANAAESSASRSIGTSLRAIRE